MELTKMKKSKSDSGGANVIRSRWQYFKSLSFLQKVVGSRKSSAIIGNYEHLKSQEEILQNTCPDVFIENEIKQEHIIKNSNTEVVIADDVEERVINCCSPQTINSQTPSFPPYPTTSNNRHTVNRIKRKRFDEYLSTMLNIEKKKLEILSNKKSRDSNGNGDEHLMFFKALLPHVRKIQTEKIIPFRNSIQDVVQRFAYPLRYSTTATDNTANYVCMSEESDCGEYCE